jgi:hypothetical protein
LWGRAEVAQTMYTYVSKCKNDKIKGKKELQAQAIKKKRKENVVFTYNGILFSHKEE